jgi:hypothetical protein
MNSNPNQQMETNDMKTKLAITAITLWIAASAAPAQAGWVDSPGDDAAQRKWPAPYSQLLQLLPDGTWVNIQRCKKITTNAPVPVANGPMQAPRVWCRIKAGGVWGWTKGSLLMK